MLTIHTINGVEYTNIKLTAEYLGMSIEGIRNLIRNGKLSVLKISERKFYIPTEEVKQLVK